MKTRAPWTYFIHTIDSDSVHCSIRRFCWKVVKLSSARLIVWDVTNLGCHQLRVKLSDSFWVVNLLEPTHSDQFGSKRNWKSRWHWCWWHLYVGDFMLVTDLRCWWRKHYVGDFFRYVDEFFNVLNRSLTSQTCDQHIWFPLGTSQHPSPTFM